MIHDVILMIELTSDFSLHTRMLLDLGARSLSPPQAKIFQGFSGLQVI